MIKKSLTILALAAMLASTLNAQWTNEGGWPDTTYKGGTHGIAVDPDGKVWVASYYQDVPWAVAEGDTVNTSGILVFNADGTEADISPITHFLLDGGFTVDTLNGACRGLEADENGNILYVQSGPAMARKINYQTGEQMASHLTTEHGSSPTGAGIADDGTIFIGPVVGGGATAIAMYDTDLNYLGNAVDGPQNISRVLEVSGDGNTIYWHAFTGPINTVVYHRADEFSSYDSVGVILEGMSVESSEWNPATGKLWVSNDARGPDSTKTHLTWYEVDVDANTVGDSFMWDPNTDATEYPRALDFSPDGMTAYVGTFTTASPRIQKFTKGAAEPASVTFKCDMSIQVDIGEFDPANDAMQVAGTFTNWADNAITMTDDDSDLIYTVTVDDLTAGEEIAFKFIKGGDGWEGIDDRKLTPVAGANTYEAFFNNFEGGTQITLQFVANMEFEIVSGRMDPSADTLTTRGSHNGWSSDDIMLPSVGDPNIYEGFVDVEVNVGDVINYKYAYTHGPGVNWENDPNKTYTITADDITNQFAVASRTYNDLTINNVLRQAAEIEFVVDMNGAINNLTGSEFTSVENVFIAGAVPPLSWPGGGWPDEDDALVHFLTDQGGGMWSVTLTFPQYSPLRIQYKYGANWGLASNGGANDNEAGVGEDHFLTLDPATWVGTMSNGFGDTGEHSLTTDVADLGGDMPSVYSLDQNYPNPFNPTTNIRFSVPKAGVITLKVYDVLGQEVAELLNDFKNAGSYEVTFDASSLTTGMYVYTITSGDFVSSKKMILVK